MSTVKRPLSPHLQVYAWGWHMATSIFHRATGVALSAGSLLLAWWLVAAATSQEAFITVQQVALSPLGLLVLFGFSWAVFQHMCSGIRHLFLDTGAGYELGANKRSSMLTFFASTLLTLAVWGVVLSNI